MSRRVKITVAEPSTIVRSGMLALLKQLNMMHLEVCEVAQAEQFRSSIAWQKPDILIVNPSLVGLFSLSQIKKDSGNPDMKCVALHLSLTEASLLKSYDEVISIYDSIEQVREKITRLVSEPEEADRRHESLSQREKEIIVYVIQGMTNKQIADKLFLSVHTVITHRRNISAKLDIHSTAGLTIYAIVNKLVELNDINTIPQENA